MEHKKSARLFFHGLIWFFIGGVLTLVGLIAVSATTRSGYYGSSGPDGSAVAMALLGGLASIVGIVLFLVGAYRAMVKIDAIVAPAPIPKPAVEPESASVSATSETSLG